MGLKVEGLQDLQSRIPIKLNYFHAKTLIVY